MKRQDDLGRFTKDFSILITKELQSEADKVGVKVKNIIKNELDEKYKTNVFYSYAPISRTGKAIQNYNDEHAHQKTASYHHTGLFMNSIKTVIDNNVVKVMIKDLTYPDGASTTQVYEWLTKGTTDHPTKDSYPYVKKQSNEYLTGWASYNPTPKHLFEEHTLLQMEGFLETLSNDLKNNPDKYM